MIGLTLLLATIDRLTKLEEYRSTKILPKISLETSLYFDYCFSFMLIMVDMFKIVFDCNTDGLIKIFLSLTICNLFFSTSGIKLGHHVDDFKKAIIKLSYPPDETVDLTGDVDNRRAIS